MLMSAAFASVMVTVICADEPSPTGFGATASVATWPTFTATV